jgi:SNF2 family DNA or RNA helicase
MLSFKHLFRNPIEKEGDGARQHTLSRRVKPFMLRRTKSEVMQELPDKTEIIQSVELSGAQQDLYEAIRVTMHDKVRKEIESKGIARSQIIILDALLKLRQVCCDPRLVPMEAAAKVKKSAKLELLMEMLPEMVEEGRKILLFSQFTSMLALIEEELKIKKLAYTKLTGRTQNRELAIMQFQNGDVPIFLISLKAGGTGLNLTAADTVIHYDPWWNPAVENQATDRAHRMGQDKHVFVYKFLTENTVETKIQELQQRKRALSDALFVGGSNKSSAKLNHADLEALFEPLI